MTPPANIPDSSPDPSASPRPKPRVLMVAHGFPPTFSVGVLRTVRYAKYLRDFGWEPIVLTAEPSAAGRAVDESLAFPEDLAVYRTDVHAPRKRVRRFIDNTKSTAGKSTGGRSNGNGGAAREPRQRRTWPRSWIHAVWSLFVETPDPRIGWKGPASAAARRAIEEHAPSVIYSTGPPHSTHVIAESISRASGLPLVTDFRDPWAGSPWQEVRRNPIGYRFIPRFERRVLRSAAYVILNTPALAQDFRDRYPEYQNKFRTITNGFDPHHLEMVEKLSHRPREVSDAFRLCHPGSLYQQRDPRPLLTAMRRLIDGGTQIKFEQIGHHSPNFRLSDLVAEAPLRDHVTIIPRLPHVDVFERMAEADCFVIIQPGTGVQIPAKVFEMIMYRKPILALTGPGATADLIRQYGLGVVVDPGDVDAILRALKRLADRSDTREGNWDRALADFDGRRLTGALADCLTEAARRPRG